MVNHSRKIPAEVPQLILEKVSTIFHWFVHVRDMSQFLASDGMPGSSAGVGWCILNAVFRSDTEGEGEGYPVHYGQVRLIYDVDCVFRLIMSACSLAAV